MLVVASILLLTGVRNMVNPGIISRTGTLGSNLEDTGSYSKKRGAELLHLALLTPPPPRAAWRRPALI